MDGFCFDLSRCLPLILSELVVDTAETAKYSYFLYTFRSLKIVVEEI